MTLTEWINPSSNMKADQSPDFPVGARVYLGHLVSTGLEYNGMKGKVVSTLHDNGRYDIRLLVLSVVIA